jgi:hypothetical protein
MPHGNRRRNTDGIVPPRIPLDFTVENLRTLLEDAAAARSPYSHQQIARWAWLFWFHHEQRMPSGYTTASERRAIEAAMDVAIDVDLQLDMYLVNPYPIAELKAMDMATVQLPVEWFATWARQLDDLES